MRGIPRHRAGEHGPDERRPDERRIGGHRTGGQRPEEHRSEEHRPGGHRVVGRRILGRRVVGRRTVVGLAIVLVVPAVLLVVPSGCSHVPAEPPPVPTTLSPAADAADVAPRSPVAASTEGAFTDVTLTAQGGAPLPGTLSPDRKRWTPTAPLAYGATYTWGGTVTAPGARPTPLTGSFRTVAPTRQTGGTLNIGDGRSVGIAAPIAIQFDAPVVDKAAVERALSVQTSVPTEGSWAWLPDQDGGSRVHWRPKEYWKAGTKVSVRADLFGLPLGGGAWGHRDLTSSFTIGRAQIVKADVGSFRMVVVRDGHEVTDVPASYGLDADPNRTTRSGIHVVTEKFTDKRMVSRQYDYDTVEHWAVRMSDNGEFIHANPASAAAQGSSNVTHGCVNLSPADAQSYYDTALYGDPVEVTGSGVALSPRDGDVFDWAVDWSQWKAASALT